jgi:solute carrier family 30 (zinc transporter), member 1
VLYRTWKFHMISSGTSGTPATTGAGSLSLYHSAFVLRKGSLSVQEGEQSMISWYKDKDALRFLSMLVLTGGFFIVELVGGIVIGSLALMADAFHMLSDMLALIVGFYALRLSRRHSSSNASFGWARAEVIGALVNGAFLLAMCLSIFIEAVHRLIEWWPKPNSPDGNAHNLETLSNNSNILIIIASVGLGINLVGLFIFGHSHGSHSHGSHGNHSPESHARGRAEAQTRKNMNIEGVFLHVLGDALGSIGVLSAGIIIEFSGKSPYRFLADPAASLLIVVIIICSAIPLLKRCISILMEKVPNSVDIGALRTDLLAVHGVVGLHDLHVWALTDEKVIGTCHVTVIKGVDYADTCDRLKTVSHRHGVHKSAIQIEFIDDVCNVPPSDEHIPDTCNKIEHRNIRWCEDIMCKKDGCEEAQIS